ncbi:MAG TPA: hypothetical protein VK688_10750 [Gemmatimonadales bacterium]|nr:hypothetical protein [Gemmatimonadales bacterium]
MSPSPLRRRPLVGLAPVGIAVLIAAAAAPLPNGSGPFDQAQAAFMSHDFAGAESAYRVVLTDDTVEAHKREAAVTLAAIAWRVRQDTATAAKILADAAGTKWGGFAARLERSRMLREVGDYAGARTAASDATNFASTPAERDDATVAWAHAAIAPALGDRLHGTKAATDPAILHEAVARLDSLVRRAPGRLDPARLLVLGAALAGDHTALARGWRSYYLVGTGDTLRGPLASARRALHARAGSLMRALAESRLFDAAAAVALEPPGATTRAPHDAAPHDSASHQPARYDAVLREPESREIVAYAAYTDTVTRLTNEYYRKTALGQGDTLVWRAGLDSAGQALWPALRWSGAVPEFTRDRLEAELDRRFGAVVNFGETAGYQDLHMGHRVVDEHRAVRQYGRVASVRFVALDGMVSNGFQSWAWDGRAEHGGWGNQSTIVQIRTGYAESPLHAWRDLTDTARVRKAAERIAEDSVADMELGRRKPIGYFPSVEERLERDGRHQLLDSLIRKGIKGAELEAAFERGIGDAVVEFSIFAHEGRHAIDDGLGAGKMKASELEYRAKLSQVAFAPLPRLAFDGIMSPNVGDETPHGVANRWMLEGIEQWMRKHAAELPVDPSAPLLPQLPRLSDASLRAAAASLDPLAPRGGRKRSA